jgi:hypothetical protein
MSTPVKKKKRFQPVLVEPFSHEAGDCDFVVIKYNGDIVAYVPKEADADRIADLWNRKVPKHLR